MTDKQNYFTYTDNTSDSNDKTMENLHKQIMIDGVDVSGCEYFKINRGFNCYKVHNCTDKECYNCYYKQLKAKEQEVDVLKAENRELKAVHSTNVALSDKLFKYKAENERLKEALAESDNDCFRLENENNLLKAYRSITPLKVEMLVQTLNEIKEIAEPYYTLGSKNSPVAQILQKISECEVE